MLDITVKQVALNSSNVKQELIIQCKDKELAINAHKDINVQTLVRHNLQTATKDTIALQAMQAHLMYLAVLVELIVISPTSGYLLSAQNALLECIVKQVHHLPQDQVIAMLVTYAKVAKV